jgi:hypothetical protein
VSSKVNLDRSRLGKSHTPIGSAGDGGDASLANNNRRIAAARQRLFQKTDSCLTSGPEKASAIVYLPVSASAQRAAATLLSYVLYPPGVRDDPAIRSDVEATLHVAAAKLSLEPDSSGRSGDQICCVQSAKHRCFSVQSLCNCSDRN